MAAGTYRVGRHAGNSLAASVETKRVVAAPITGESAATHPMYPDGD